jgi:protoheme IX farnesyltransferase
VHSLFLALHSAAVAAAVATYLLIVVGAIVRTTGSGLGCPDWPLCHGQLLPPPDTAAIIEYTHRFLGAIVSPLILAVSLGCWLARPRERAVLVPGLLAPLLLAIQIGLGAVVVRLELPAMVVLVHFGFAMLIFSLLVWIAVWTGAIGQAGAARPVRAPMSAKALTTNLAGAGVPSELRRLVLATTGLAFLLILSGAYVRAIGASWACMGFPTCNGQVLPFGSSPLVDIHLIHRLLAYSVAWLVGLVLYQVFRSDAVALRAAAGAATVLIVVQIGLGAIAVTLGPSPVLQTLHVAGAAAVWASLVGLTALAWRAREVSFGEDSLQTRQRKALGTWPGSAGILPARREAPRRVRPLRAEQARRLRSQRLTDPLAAYLELTKPRVMSLLLITTLASMMVAAGGMPALPLVFFTLVGGALASGGASAINHYLDRDIDGLMGRTALRPIPAGAVSAGRALAFGITLGGLSFVVLAVFVNLLAAVLSFAALLFYVFVYTRWLKRSSPSNIVIGGAAGAVPPLVGWAAVTGEISLLALYLFAIVFFWTPPHFWALALIMRREYERARIPMLPIVRGDDEARRQILLYSLQLVALTVVVFALGLLGRFYLVAALLLGGIFIVCALRLWREASVAAARSLFRYSIVYLTLLFAAMVVDRQLIV